VKGEAVGVDVKAAAAVTDHIHSGKCLCGAVTYRAANLQDIWYCHCNQCRRLTGHFLAACRTERKHVSIEGDVTWAPHSGTAEHGRCTQCGSLLFWSNTTSPLLNVLPGSLDDSSGLGLLGHLYVSEKGTYYTIDDALPQYAKRPQPSGPVVS
jgi:hypothetical protein